MKTVRKGINKFFEQITSLGGVVFFLVLLIMFLGIGRFDVFRLLLMGMVIIYVITVGIRSFYFKPRPNKLEYNNIIDKIDAGSFPSVHAARSVLLFMILTEFFFVEIISKTFLFILMLLIFYSRIYLRKHYLIDIVGGIVLGFSVGWLVI